MTSISRQNEELLRQLVASGRFRSEDEALAAAIRLLQDQSEGDDAAQRQASDVHSTLLPPDQWLEEFHHWTRRPRQGNPDLDDSRESIYG